MGRAQKEPAIPRVIWSSSESNAGKTTPRVTDSLVAVGWFGGFCVSHLVRIRPWRRSRTRKVGFHFDTHCECARVSKLALAGSSRGGAKVARGGAEEDEEDYGDYVTRCICGYTHDDGFMVQCDGCK